MDLRPIALALALLATPAGAQETEEKRYPAPTYVPPTYSQPAPASNGGSFPGISWREYVDGRFIALEQITEQRFLLGQLAIDKAEEAQKLRDEKNNEFRLQLTEQARTFLPRAEFEQAMAAWMAERQQLQDRISSLDLSRAELAGKASTTAVYFGFAAALTVSVLASWLMRRPGVPRPR